MARGELSSLINSVIPMESARPEIWVFWRKSTAFMRLRSGARVAALKNSLFVCRTDFENFVWRKKRENRCLPTQAIVGRREKFPEASWEFKLSDGAPKGVWN